MTKSSLLVSPDCAVEAEFASHKTLSDRLRNRVFDLNFGGDFKGFL